MEFGKALIQMRARRGMSQAELHIASGVQPALISMIETGKVKEPSAQVVTSLRVALHWKDKVDAPLAAFLEATEEKEVV